MEECRVPLQPDRAANIFDGSLVLAHLGGNHAEKMERVGVIRLDRKNLPIDLLGSLQSTGLMVLNGNRQCFENCCHLRPRQAVGLSIR